MLNMITLIVAVLAYFVARSTLRHQRDALLLVQLNEKAKNCNSFVRIPSGITDPDQISGVLSHIVIARQMLQLYEENYLSLPRRLDKFLFVRFHKDFLIDNFYLSLHTSVRGWLQDRQEADLANETWKKQLRDSKAFLQGSIDRWK